jgi:hypothetical protein
MASMQKIALSFFPLARQDFDFRVYRYLYEDDTKSDYPDCSRRRLPSDRDGFDQGATYTDYWVSFEPKEGFESYICNSFTNFQLTLDLLFYLLRHSCADRLPRDKFIIPDGFRKRMILFVLRSFPEGKQVVWLEPYFLKVVRKVGFLADFKLHTST